jgi:signal transduction histidine kinase
MRTASGAEGEGAERASTAPADGGVAGELVRLAGFLSHELRQPVGALHIWIELLEASCGEDLGERGQRYLREIANASRQLGDMLTAEVELLRLAAVPLARARFPLAELMSEIVTALKPSLEAASARVEVGPLPSLDADRARIGELLRHLLECAIAHRRADTPPYVRIGAEPAGASCRITIEQEHSRFPLASAEGVFEHTARLDPGVPGSGVQLAACRRIAQRHGGTVRAEPAPQDGVRFVLDLPADRCIW